MPHFGRRLGQNRDSEGELMLRVPRLHGCATKRHEGLAASAASWHSKPFELFSRVVRHVLSHEHISFHNFLRYFRCLNLSLQFSDCTISAASTYCTLCFFLLMVSIESVSGFHVPSKTSESETCIKTGGWRLLGWVYQENDMFHQQTRVEAFLRCWSNILGRWKQPTYTCREGVQERQSMLSSTNNNNKIQNRRSDEFQHFETLMTYMWIYLLWRN